MKIENHTSKLDEYEHDSCDAWPRSSYEIATMLRYNAQPGTYPEPYDTLCKKAFEYQGDGLSQIAAYHKAYKELVPIKQRNNWESVKNNFIHLKPDSRIGHRIVHTSDEAFEQQAERQCLVDGLIAPGNLTLIYGKAGIGKSYAVMHLATCIALGKSWLDHDTTQSTVLYVDEESGLFNMKQRIVNIFNSFDVSLDVPFRFMSLECFDFMSDVDIADLHWIIKATKAKLIVIDTFANVLSGGNENATGHVQPIFQKLRTIASQEDAAFLIIHHPNKGGKLRGNSAIEGAMDMILRAYKRSSKLCFRMQKIRDTKLTNLAGAIKWTEETFSLTVGKFETETSKQNSVCGVAQDYVIRYLAEHGPSRSVDIQKNAKGCKPSSAKQALEPLVKLSYISKVKRGVYKLTDKGREYVKSNSM